MKHTTVYTVIKPFYFAYWSDLWGFPVAQALLPFVASIPGITPNSVTIVSFLLHLFGCVSLLLLYPYHLFVAGILLILAFIGDDLDGQLARSTNQSSVSGDYLDKVLDYVKIYVLLLVLAYTVYTTTHEILPLLLGFTACFCYTFRMYLKYVTMFSAFSQDNQYFTKSEKKREELLQTLSTHQAQLVTSMWGKIRLLARYNRSIFFVDEAEIAVFTAVGAFFHQLTLALWVITISQVIISVYKFFERLIQLQHKSERLFYPMRK